LTRGQYCGGGRARGAAPSPGTPAASPEHPWPVFDQRSIFDRCSNRGQYFHQPASSSSCTARARARNPAGPVPEPGPARTARAGSGAAEPNRAAPRRAGAGRDFKLTALTRFFFGPWPGSPGVAVLVKIDHWSNIDLWSNIDQWSWRSCAGARNGRTAGRFSTRRVCGAGGGRAADGRVLTRGQYLTSAQYLTSDHYLTRGQ
jgi:hypothetical protein